MDSPYGHIHRGLGTSCKPACINAYVCIMKRHTFSDPIGSSKGGAEWAGHVVTVGDNQVVRRVLRCKKAMLSSRPNSSS